MSFSTETQALIDEAEGTLHTVLSTRAKSKEDAAAAKVAADNATTSANDAKAAAALHAQALSAALDAIRVELTPPEEEVRPSAAARNARPVPALARSGG